MATEPIAASMDGIKSMPAGASPGLASYQARLARPIDAGWVGFRPSAQTRRGWRQAEASRDAALATAAAAVWEEVPSDEMERRSRSPARSHSLSPSSALYDHARPVCHPNASQCRHWIEAVRAAAAARARSGSGFYESYYETDGQWHVQVNERRPEPTARSRQALCGASGMGCCARHDKLRGIVLLALSKAASSRSKLKNAVRNMLRNMFRSRSLQLKNAVRNMLRNATLLPTPKRRPAASRNNRNHAIESL